MKNISEKLFFFSYGIYLIFNIVNTSFYSIYISSYMKYIMILCTIILIFKEILCKRLLKKEFFLLLICGFLLSFILLHVNGYAMFPLFFFIYSARNIDFKKITKFTYILSFVLLLFIIASAYAGIIENYKIVTIEMARERTREYLGFRYPLFPQMILFNITACFLYTYKNKSLIIKGIILAILNYLVFLKTDSRLSCYLSILLIIGVIFVQLKPNFLDNKKILCYILALSFPICSILSIGMTLNYNINDSRMVKLDEFLGGRLHLGKNSFNEYNINLFGNNTEYIGAGLDQYGRRTVGKYNYVDCLYINMLEKYGLIFNIVFLSLLSYILYATYKTKNYVLFIILIGFALHGIIDDLEIYLYYNAFWLAISNYFRKNKRNILQNESDLILNKEEI